MNTASKLERLYWCDTSKSELKLEVVADTFKEDGRAYLTDEDGVIFYTKAMEEIEDSYQSKGELYKFTVGSEPRPVADDIMYLRVNDTQYVSAEKPIAAQFLSKEEDNLFVRIGIIEDDAFKILIDNVDY